MATSYKILGQVHPSTTNDTELYEVGVGSSAVVSTITACNVTGSAAEINIHAVQAGDSPSENNALVYEVALSGNSTQALTLGVTLDEGEALWVTASAANAVTFTAFGSEIL